MKNNLFLLLLSFVMLLLFSNGIHAQKEKSLGVNVGMGFLDEADFTKVGAEFNLDVSEHFRFSPSVGCYFSSSSTTLSLDGDLSYLIKTSEKFEFFPIVGVTYIAGDVDGFGANLGMGLQYDLSANFAINAKAKYQLVKDWDEIVIGVGLVRKF